MNEILSCDAAPSLALYFSVTNPANGQYFDWANAAFRPLVHLTITGITTGSAGAAAFAVSGNVLSQLPATGGSIRVRGTTGGTDDAVCTIRAGSAYNSGTGKTTINVNEAVSSGTVSGTVDLNCTPYIATTELTNGGGSGISRYTASLNLNTINPTTTLAQYAAQAFQPTSASPFPVPDADTPQSSAVPLTIQLGLLGPQEICVGFAIGTTSTAGTTTQLAAWLECNGQLVNPITVDPNGSGGSNSTCTVTVVQFGQTSGGLPAFTVTTGTFGQPTSDGRFEATESYSGYTGDQQYSALVTLVVNGNTFTADVPFPVFP
jgi:hypothetical protein